MLSTASATSPAVFPGRSSGVCGTATPKEQKKGWETQALPLQWRRHCIYRTPRNYSKICFFFLQTQNLLSEQPELVYSDDSRNRWSLESLVLSSDVRGMGGKRKKKFDFYSPQLLNLVILFWETWLGGRLKACHNYYIIKCHYFLIKIINKSNGATKHLQNIYAYIL